MGKATVDDAAELRIALLMCAAHCQGGHSEAGAEAAKALGTRFPITMEGLAKVARRHGLDRDKLWPWWKRMREERQRLIECPRCGEADERSQGQNVCGLCECHFYVGKGWTLQAMPAALRDDTLPHSPDTAAASEPDPGSGEREN